MGQGLRTQDWGILKLGGGHTLFPPVKHQMHKYIYFAHFRTAIVYSGAAQRPDLLDRLFQ